MTLTLVVQEHGKAIVVKGDTRHIKEELKGLNGKWFHKETGWIFPGSHKAKVIVALRAIPQVTSVVDQTSTRDQVPVLDTNGKPQNTVSNMMTNDDGDLRVDLGGCVFINVDDYMGKRGVDFRKYYPDRDSHEMKPTAKGIRLTPAVWKTLYETWDQIDALSKTAVEKGEEQKMNVSGDVFVQLGKDFVDLREFYTDKVDGLQKPGKKGVRLTLAAWAIAKKAKDNIKDAIGDCIDTEVQEPKQKRQKTAPAAAPPKIKVESDADLKAAIRTLLEGRDLGAVTPKQIRRELEEKLGVEPGAMDKNKDTIKAMLQELIVAS